MLVKPLRTALPIVLSLSLVGCFGNSDSSTPAFASATVAGGATSGTTDGDISVALFSNPVKVAVDTDGTIYVSDFDNNRVRKIVGNTVSTLVNQANFSRPFGLTIAPDGTLYVSTDDDDTLAHSGSTGTIWKVDKTTGAATVVAKDIGRPRGIATLADGTIVASDLTRNIVSLVNPTTGVLTVLAGTDGTAGAADGTGTAASFSRPYGCCVLPTGEILVADQSNNKIRQISAGGVVTTYAGTGAPGRIDSSYGSSTFNGPQDVVYNKATGDIYVADTTGVVIRRLRSGQVLTVAGNGTLGYVEASGTNSEYYGLEGIAVNADGSKLIIADGNGGNGTNFNRIRSLNLN